MSYSDLHYAMQAQYGRAMNDIGLILPQAFAMAYDEMYIHLTAQDNKVQVMAFTALFTVAIEGGMRFELSDPFVRDVIEELSVAYSKLHCLTLNEKSSADDELMLGHVKGVLHCLENWILVGRINR